MDTIIENWINETWYKKILKTELIDDVEFYSSYKLLFNLNLKSELRKNKDISSLEFLEEPELVLNKFKKNNFSLVYKDKKWNAFFFSKDNRIVIFDAKEKEIIMFYQFKLNENVLKPPTLLLHKSNKNGDYSTLAIHDDLTLFCGELSLDIGFFTFNKYLESIGEFVPWNFNLFSKVTQNMIKALSIVTKKSLIDFL